VHENIFASIYFHLLIRNFRFAGKFKGKVPLGSS
jgi:hypothetical protein